MLSPSSRFTVQDDIYEAEDPDVPTMRVRDSSTRDCYAAPTFDQESRYQGTAPTLRTPISRPIRINEQR